MKHFKATRGNNGVCSECGYGLGKHSRNGSRICPDESKAKRGAPRRYSEGSKRFNVTIDGAVIAAWRAAGGTDLPSDVAKAFSEKYRLQLPAQ